MKISIFFSLAFLIGMASCSKPVEIAPDPEVASSFTRTLSYPNQNGTVKQATYDVNYKMETIADIQEGQLQMIFVAAPKANGTAGDAIVLHINADNINSGLVKTYRFNDPNSPISYCRYTYSFMNNSGDIWGSITDSKIGVQFEGSLQVTKYDARRKLISGHYDVYAKGLINDPTMRNGGTIIDPVNQCDLHVTGAFSDLKIQ